MKTEPYVLVIDDENYICESCERIFANAGYKVDTSVSAGMGFRQALLNPYDAIILDLKLIEEDGLKLLSGIRKRKPEVPVVIITGYPSEETRKMSTTLGATKYITKPFEPAEILEPVQKAISFMKSTTTMDRAIIEDKMKETGYRFHLSSWFYKVENGIIRVGGYLPNLSNNYIRYIRLPEVGSKIYRELPLVEVTLTNGSRQIIPSSVSGKILLVNQQLKDHYYNLEKNIHKKSWIATVEPDDFEEDLKASETRNILVFADKDSEEYEYFIKLVHNGYATKMTSDISRVRSILSEGVISVLVMDAANFEDDGPIYVKLINREFPHVKIIVLNEPDLNNELLYRKCSIFYYGVNPISNNEMVDILHCAFQQETAKIQIKNPSISRFLPNRISKISIVNRFGKKVTLLADGQILQNNVGLGYLLARELLDMGMPVQIKHSRSGKWTDQAGELQNIEKEKENNDRVIILKSRDIKRIPGSILKEIQQYTNRNCAGNLLIKIDIQPDPALNNKVEFDYTTTIALKNLIKNDMMCA